MSSPLEAFRWWNSTLNPFGETDKPPVCVIPSAATPVWKMFFPSFLFFVSEEQQPDKYWESIAAVVQKFCKNETIPNPITRFPDFISLLYSIRFTISPRSINNCLLFLETYRYTNFASFILYDTPLFFGEPFLYLNTILYICDHRTEVWGNMVGNPAIIEAFFNLYITFMLPVTESYPSLQSRQRILIGEIIFQLIERCTPSYQNLVSLLTRYIDVLIKIASSNNLEFQMTVVRWAARILLISKKKFDKDLLHIKAKGLIKALSPDSAPFNFVINYFKDKGVISTYSLIQLTPIVNLHSLELAESFATRDPVSAIAKLTRASFSNKIFFRACFKTIREILLEHSNSSQIKEWMQTCIRRFFIFIPLAHAKQKYKTRTLYLCEQFASISKLHNVWLYQTIMSCAATVANKSVPSYFGGFFHVQNASLDEQLYTEFDAFSSLNLDLKSFPFDGNKSVLLLPPNTINPQNTSSMILPQKKTMTKATSAKNLNPVRINAGRKKQNPVIKKPKTAKPPNRVRH